MSRDLNRMVTGLRRYLGGGEALTSITALSTGHSNETYRLEGIDRILRMPPSKEGLLPPYDMAAQHAVLRAVGEYEHGAPVPKVYELCTDASVIGDAFFIMENMRGEAFEYAVPAWLQNAPPSTPDRMCAQWMAAVTAVHRMPVELMPARSRTPVDEARHWRKVAEEAEAAPLLLEVLDDLIARPPRPSGAPTPIHGDPKHGNCLWSNEGRLLALLDWEMAGVGDPLLDLGYIAHFYDQGDAPLGSAGYELPGWWPRAKMIEAWESATGRRAIDLERYEAIEVAKIAAIIALGFQLYRSGRADDQRFAAWEPVIAPYVTLAARMAAKG